MNEFIAHMNHFCVSSVFWSHIFFSSLSFLCIRNYKRSTFTNFYFVHLFSPDILYGVQLIRYRKSQLRRKKTYEVEKKKFCWIVCFFFLFCVLCLEFVTSTFIIHPHFFVVAVAVVVARTTFSFGENRMQQLR